MSLSHRSDGIIPSLWMNNKKISDIQQNWGIVSAVVGEVSEFLEQNWIRPTGESPNHLFFWGGGAGYFFQFVNCIFPTKVWFDPCNLWTRTHTHTHAHTHPHTRTRTQPSFISSSTFSLLFCNNLRDCLHKKMSKHYCVVCVAG